MTLKLKPEWVITGISLIVGAAGLGHALGQRKKMNDISAKLNKTIEELSSDINVDISEQIVKDATDRAVEREAQKAAHRVYVSIHNDIYKQVREAVEEERKDICDEVRKEVAKQVKKIDIDDLKEQVVEKARENAEKKLKGAMDDILSSFKQNLSIMSSAYQSIAASIPSSATEIKLKVEG